LKIGGVLAWVALSIWVWVLVVNGVRGLLDSLDEPWLVPPPFAGGEAEPILVAPDLEVLALEFVTIEGSPDDEEWKMKRHAEVPGEVPRLIGRHFGWVMFLETDREIVSWREVMRGEQAIPVDEDIRNDPQIRFSADGRELTSERESVVMWGLDPNGLSVTYIYHSWFVTEEDVPGDYEIEVFLEGQRIGTLPFRLLEGP
jgi:hypothetical protein